MGVELRILGALEVSANGHEVPVRAAKQRELLGILLLHPGEVVSRDRLVDALWGERPPETATKALQVHISQLRKASVAIETRAPGYLLRVEDEAVDAARFERLARDGAAALAAGEPERASALLSEGLALWRGPPLADLAYASFAQPEIARLEELRLDALEERVEADLALGRGGLVGELEALVARHPLRERLRRQLMLALYRAGRQAEALEAYRDARTTLVEELGLEPSPELQELERAILVQDPALAAAPARAASDFVGRDRELALLAARLDDAVAGRGSLVLIAGEAGIGKSRLCGELATRAGSRGARVLTGRCWEAGGAPPFWPWIDALRPYVPFAELAPPAEPGEDPEAARFRLFDAVASHLRDAAADRPVVLILDDVQAADAPSLLLLRFLAQTLGDARLLVVAAYREGEVGAEHPLAVDELLRSRQAERLALRGLAAADVERFLTLAAGHDVGGRVAREIHAGTDGNALFVTEIARLLLAEDRLEAWSGRLPEGVRDVIARRLGLLPGECRKLLVTASILGREFRLNALERVAGVSREEVLVAIDAAVVARVVEEAPARGALRFSHALVRDALYDELTPAGRARGHARAGAALEELYAADPEPHLAELAFHFCVSADAGTAARAVGYAERAAARAAEQLAYEESVRLYELALDVLEREAPGEAERQCRLLLRMADAQTRAGEGVEARATNLRASRIASRAGLAELLAEAALAPAGRFMWMRAASDPQLVPLLEQALAALGDVEHPLRARLMARLAPAVRGELDWEPRIALGDQAVAMARRLDDPATLAFTLSVRSSGLEGPFTIEQLRADAEEVIALGEQLGDAERVFSGVESRLIASWLRGDRAAIDADRALVARLVDEIDQPAQRWYLPVVETLTATFDGRFEEAESLADEALRLGERTLRWQPSMYHDLQLW